MSETQTDAITQRLERLERGNRGWKILGSAAVAILGLTFLIGAAGGKGSEILEEVRATKFVVVDENENRWGELTVSQGTPALNLFDVSGERRLVLTVDSGRLAFGLLDANGNTLVAISIAPEIQGLAIADRNGRPRLAMGVKRAGPGLTFFDANAAPVWSAP